MISDFYKIVRLFEMFQTMEAKQKPMMSLPHPKHKNMINIKNSEKRKKMIWPRRIRYSKNLTRFKLLFCANFLAKENINIFRTFY